MEIDTDEIREASKQPPKFLDTIKNLNLIEGQTALLNCKYSPPDDPNLKIAWLLNGKVTVLTIYFNLLSFYLNEIFELQRKLYVILFSSLFQFSDCN